MLGEHEMIAKWFSLYEEALRTPLVIRLPDGRGLGETREQMIEMVDVAPTLLELAAVPAARDPDLDQWEIPHAPMSGRSFAALFDAPDKPHKDTVFSMYENALMVRTERYKLCLYAERSSFNYPDQLFEGADEAGELYDLAEDPGEHDNLYERPELAPVQADLARRLAQHQIRNHHWLGKHGTSPH
jgi:arylsulfatase A-like enzyme